MINSNIAAHRRWTDSWGRPELRGCAQAPPWPMHATPRGPVPIPTHHAIAGTDTSLTLSLLSHGRAGVAVPGPSDMARAPAGSGASQIGSCRSGSSHRLAPHPVRLTAKTCRAWAVSIHLSPASRSRLIETDNTNQGQMLLAGVSKTLF